MLFITNRALKQGVSTDKTNYPRDIDFDPTDNSVQHSVSYCRTKTATTYEEIGSDVFLQELKASKAEQIALFLHGYSNTATDALTTGAKLDRMFRVAKPNLVQVVPLIWPAASQSGGVTAYWDDEKAADASAFAFSRVLDCFEDWRTSDANTKSPCLKRINVIAHSMGNRVFRETMRAWAKYSRHYAVPLLFRNSFLIAADVVNESLHRGESAQFISDASRNVVVYFASDDVALRASKVVNVPQGDASRRLGHTGPEDMTKVPANVYSVDCDEVNTVYDPAFGHTYFLEDDKGRRGVVFNDMYQAILKGRAYYDDPSQRTFVL